MWRFFSNFNLFFSILQITSGNTYPLVCNPPDFWGIMLNLREIPQGTIASCENRELWAQRVLVESTDFGLTLTDNR